MNSPKYSFYLLGISANSAEGQLPAKILPELAYLATEKKQGRRYFANILAEIKALGSHQAQACSLTAGKHHKRATKGVQHYSYAERKQIVAEKPLGEVDSVF